MSLQRRTPQERRERAQRRAERRAEPVTAAEIVRALRARHDRERNGSSRAWAFFEELRLGSGFAGVPGRGEERDDLSHVAQRLDAFALCVWPSSGYRRIAYEVKVSRSDFRAEIARPEKRAPALTIANEFYIVVPEGLVDVSEVPEDCGLMDYRRPLPASVARTGQERTGLRIVRRAMWHRTEEPSWRLVASILRAASRD
jgi:hypothetical protein